MFQFNIIIYITILLSTIIGCDCKRLSNIIFTNPNQGNTKPIIVLLHGLGSTSNAFKHLIPKLKQGLPGVDVVALTSVEKTENIMGLDVSDTCIFSIKDQAAKCFQELSEKIVNDLKNRPMVLIGHSQGGLRAYTMYEKYKNGLNVKGIITIGTPWEGAPLLDVDYEPATRKLEEPNLVHEMEMLSKSINEDPNYVKGFLEKILQGYNFANKLPIGTVGALDLKPGSQFLDWVKDRLPNADVPILFIGGEGSDLRVFSHKESNNDFKLLHATWTGLVVDEKDHNKAHDMVVPLSSALAENIAPRHSENFKRFSISDAIHDGLLGLPDNKAFKNILKHPEMFQAVKEFCTKVLYKDSLKIQQPQKEALYEDNSKIQQAQKVAKVA